MGGRRGKGYDSEYCAGFGSTWWQGRVEILRRMIV